jgi:ATP-binding cassette subfamily F protein uup
MPVLSLRDIQLAYSDPPLLDGIDLDIEPGERICLLGRNGAGKSTLMRLIAGEIAPDDGERIVAGGMRVARLPQEVPGGTTGTVYEVVAEGLGDIGALIDRYHRLTRAMADGDESVMTALEHCQHELEAVDGWALRQRVETAIERLGLDPEAQAESLSGGMQRRLLLARALAGAPDLLLLDEPTNHLDIQAINWLEEFLLSWNGSLLFITHDRSLIQRLATRIVELELGRLRSFSCAYREYLERKQDLLDQETKARAAFDRRLAEEEVWIRQGIKARRTRNEGRVRELKKMRAERARRRERAGKAKLSLQEAVPSGRLVAEMAEVDYAIGGQAIIRGLSTTIQRGDRVGITGPNGAGKTTLLCLLIGEIPPDHGKVRLGTNLKIAYFDQHRAALDEGRSVQDNLAGGSDRIEIDGRQKHVLSYLQDFLFEPARARQPVNALSGGERNRLLLARLFSRPSNLLVMDEPTNDLDVETLELLEERLAEYQGTLLLVSHDRAFLDNVVTSTLACDYDGIFREYIGGYEDWLRQRLLPAQNIRDQVKPPGNPVRPAKKPATGKLSFRDQRELDALPQQIEALEAEIEALQAIMSEPAFFRQDKASITKAQAHLTKLNGELESVFERWETLESRRT